jgi:hypothetical protein
MQGHGVLEVGGHEDGPVRGGGTVGILRIDHNARPSHLAFGRR